MMLTWSAAESGAAERRGSAVLLHGMMSLSATWWQIGPALAADGWDVTALDLAAHGDSPRLDRPLGTDALVDRVLEQVAGPVDLLVGHSLGGVTAIATVDRDPAFARAVVLEDPPGGSWGNRAAAADGVETDAVLAATDRQQLVRRSRERNPGWAAEDVEGDVRGIEEADAPAVAAGIREGMSWDLPGLVTAAAGRQLPILVLAAAADGALAEPGRAAVRAALPADRFVELPGGHCLHRDLPDRWLAEVRAFTATLRPA